ncbi:unnamed protein product [Ilex paraguariensis]|uniref:Uncharacterized protein n=1 Tax=Ilex paraguariensis TaxID=185542 RepID=A0ABC8RQG5_9AQUA
MVVEVAKFKKAKVEEEVARLKADLDDASKARSELGEASKELQASLRAKDKEIKKLKVETSTSAPKKFSELEFDSIDPVFHKECQRGMSRMLLINRREVEKMWDYRSYAPDTFGMRIPCRVVFCCLDESEELKNPSSSSKLVS